MMQMRTMRGGWGLRGGAWLSLCLGLGCGGGGRDETDPPVVSATEGMTSHADSGSSTMATTVEPGDATSGTKLDVAFDTESVTVSAGDSSDQSGCDKVDFLFVIDNSGSMGDEQGNLINSFPAFIDTIEATLDEAQDFHIMVLDVDAWQYETCQQACESAPPECIVDGICSIMAGPACAFPCLLGSVCGIDGGYQCGVTQPEECEDVLGAGVTHPRGQGSSNTDCSFSTGARYMDSNEPDLSATFECAAQVGVSSYAGTERPMEAMVQAVTGGTPADGCNTGFLRDDAILVVTFITDENDAVGDSAGTPAGWKQALISAKNGDESAIVVLGLFGDNDQPGGICQDLVDADGAEAAPRLREFVDSFGDKGFFGSVCAPSYDEFFQEAVSLIDVTCDEFIPPEG
jgi:hypothetical protein